MFKLESMKEPRVFLRYFYTRLYIYRGYKGNNYCFAFWSRGRTWLHISFYILSSKHVNNRIRWEDGPVIRIYPFFIALSIVSESGKEQRLKAAAGNE